VLNPTEKRQSHQRTALSPDTEKDGPSGCVTTMGVRSVRSCVWRGYLLAGSSLACHRHEGGSSRSPPTRRARKRVGRAYLGHGVASEPHVLEGDDPPVRQAHAHVDALQRARVRQSAAPAAAAAATATTAGVAVPRRRRCGQRVRRVVVQRGPAQPLRGLVRRPRVAHAPAQPSHKGSRSPCQRRGARWGGGGAATRTTRRRRCAPGPARAHAPRPGGARRRGTAAPPARTRPAKTPAARPAASSTCTRRRRWQRWRRSPVLRPARRCPRRSGWPPAPATPPRRAAAGAARPRRWPPPPRSSPRGSSPVTDGRWDEGLEG
jgi:hypothetical protein